MKSLLAAFDHCQKNKIFCVGYRWVDSGKVKEGHTVVEAINGDEATAKILRQYRHITQAWVIN